MSANLTSSDAFRKKVEYLEAVDDGWRNVLADVDSLLKTLGSLTAQAATGELKSLIDISKRNQQTRRGQLDNVFEDNLAILQSGANIEETEPVGFQLNDVDFPQFIRSAKIPNNAYNNTNMNMLNVSNNSNFSNNGFGFNAFPGAGSSCQLSKSLPNTDFLLNNALPSKLLMQQNNRYPNRGDEFGPCSYGTSSNSSNTNSARRHSLFTCPGVPNTITANQDYQQNSYSSNISSTLERMVPRQVNSSLRQSHRLISSSIDSRGSGFCDGEDSFTNSQEDISPENDNEVDWDYDAVFNKVVRPGRRYHLNHHFNHNLLSMRRASSPPIPPYAFDSKCHVAHGAAADGHAHQLPRRVLLGLAESTQANMTQSQTNLSMAAVHLMQKGNINPMGEFSLDTKDARYLVIKSFTEESIFSSIKYSVWCSTFRGNQRLDKIYRAASPAPIYLFFSVNNTGNFCGVAQMISPVDFDRYAGCWSTPRWKGAFAVKWIYVKDVPFRDFRDIVLPEDGKPVCKSRDTQEVLPSAQGVKMLKIFHDRKIFSSIFDDFDFYEDKVRRQSLPYAHVPDLSSQSSHSNSHQSLHQIKATGDDDFDND